MAKHLINGKDDWASEGIKGYLSANNKDLVALKEFPNVVIRRDYATLGQNNRVAILAGGGSGHEPAHCGFIGAGMLTGVVCGHLFASPSTAAILAAIRVVGASNNAGVLLIVKNYTGDRLNFGLAAKRAWMEGINVDWILVDDDVALLEKDKSKNNEVVGSRGLCGTVLVEKLAGAMAEQGKTLKEIKEDLDDLLNSKHVRTLGISLSGRVTLPGEILKSKTEEESNLIEVGLGIHGETGRKKMPLAKSAVLAELSLNEYLLEPSTHPIKDICLMINNLGGLSNLELYLHANDCVKYIHENRPDLRIRRMYVGAFMTSLNMNGFSVTSLYIDENKVDSYLNLLDANTSAPAWPKSCGQDIQEIEYISFQGQSVHSEATSDVNEYVKFENDTKIFASLIKSFMQTISQDLINMKDYLNKLDMDCGDGDCGDSMTAISQVILTEIESGKFGDFEYPHKVLLHLGELLENGGGSLCILLALFFSAAAKAFVLENTVNEKRAQIYWLKLWYNAFDSGIDAVQEYGRAKPNQRSIVDPLTTIKSQLGDYIQAVEGSKGEKSVETSVLLKSIADSTLLTAESTAKMTPRVGRASYVDASTITTPDAGAMAVSSAMTSVHKAYLKAMNE